MESAIHGAKLLLSVEEAANALGLGRSKVYDLISKGDLPSIKIHGSRRVPVDHLKMWIANTYSAQATTERSVR